MYRRLLKTVVITSFAAVGAMPASAQIRADIGPVHIHIANEAPPPVRYERRTLQPSHDAVWVNGYWDRQHDNWAWSSGRWERRYDHRAHWVNARYRREGHAWRYEPAHWSNQQLVEGDDYRQWKSEHYQNGAQHRN
jgi:hypothetical protein